MEIAALLANFSSQYGIEAVVCIIVMLIAVGWWYARDYIA